MLIFVLYLKLINTSMKKSTKHANICALSQNYQHLYKKKKKAQNMLIFVLYHKIINTSMKKSTK